MLLVRSAAPHSCYSPFTAVNRQEEKTPVTTPMIFKDVVHVPVLSATTVLAKGLRTVGENGPLLLSEPGSAPLPGGLVVVPTLEMSERHLFPVQMMNLFDEDIWLT